MEDVTEVIVEPEPGEDDPTSAEPEESRAGQCRISSLAVNMQLDQTGEIVGGTPQGSGVPVEPTGSNDNTISVETPSPAGQPNNTNRSRRSVAFFAVFDGHGGREAAQFARDYLWEFMKKQRGFWSDCDREVCAAIRKGFVACHHAMWKKLRKLTLFQVMPQNTTCCQEESLNTTYAFSYFFRNMLTSRRFSVIEARQLE